MSRLVFCFEAAISGVQIMQKFERPCMRLLGSCFRLKNVNCSDFPKYKMNAKNWIPLAWSFQKAGGQTAIVICLGRGPYKPCKPSGGNNPCKLSEQE
jgi:hypothetical protein